MVRNQLHLCVLLLPCYRILEALEHPYPWNRETTTLSLPHEQSHLIRQLYMSCMRAIKLKLQYNLNIISQGYEITMIKNKKVERSRRSLLKVVLDFLVAHLPQSYKLLASFSKGVFIVAVLLCTAQPPSQI
jgi:hypothetical protein